MDDSIELREIIDILIKGKKLIAIVTVICIILAGIANWFVLSEKYESKAVVQVASSVQDTGILENYVATEFTPQVFLQRVKNTSSISAGFKTENIENEFIESNLSASNDATTNLINLTYKSNTPENAQKELQTIIDVTKSEMNNSVQITLQNLEMSYNSEAKALSEEIEEIINEYNSIIRDNNLPEVLILQTILNTEIVLNVTEKQTIALANVSGALQNQLLQLQAQIQTKSEEYREVLANYQSVKTGLDSFKPDPFIRIITKPTLVEEPSSPNKVMNLAIGLVLGVIIGMVIIFFRHYWKNSAPAK